MHFPGGLSEMRAYMDALQARAEKAEAEADKWEAVAANLLQTRFNLESALRGYGRHHQGCLGDVPGYCDCGLSAALEGTDCE